MRVPLPLSEPTDSEMSDMWERGDWARLAPALRTVAMKATPIGHRFDGDTMEDIASVVVARAWALPIQPTRPMGWAIVAARNYALDIQKRGHERVRRERLLVQTITQEMFHVNHVRSALDDLVVADDRATVTQVLHELPDESREILVWRDQHDMPVDDIATRLKITVGAAKMRMSRARMLFRKHWKDATKEPPLRVASTVTMATPATARVITQVVTIPSPLRCAGTEVAKPTHTPTSTRKRTTRARSVLALLAPDLAGPIDGTMPHSIDEWHARRKCVTTNTQVSLLQIGGLSASS